MDDALKIVLVLLAAIFVLPLLFMGLAGPVMGGMMGYPMGGTGGMFLFGLGWLLPLVVVALIGYAVYRVIQDGSGTDPAVQRVREAYASGEIDEEEYERRMRKLTEE